MEVTNHLLIHLQGMPEDDDDHVDDGHDGVDQSHHGDAEDHDDDEKVGCNSG